MKFPLIGITSGEIINRNHPAAPMVYGQSFTYSDAVARGSALPVTLPLLHDSAQARALYLKLDGLLLSGGNDIDPSLYGEPPHPKLGDLSPRRDAFELQLLRWALTDDKPVLAICRGLQLLNVAKGGSLYQDLASQQPHAMDHQASALAHHLEQIDQVVNFQAGSQLARILQTTAINANTYHHQAVKTVGHGLVATAWTADNVIEGLESSDHTFVLGVQSHPESIEARAEVRWQKLFTAFAKAAADFNIRSKTATILPRRASSSAG